MIRKFSCFMGAVALGAALGVSAQAAVRPELVAFPFKTGVAEAGEYVAKAVGCDFVVSGGIDGAVVVEGDELYRVTLSNAVVNGALSLGGDAQLWLVGENVIETDAESAVVCSGTLTIGGPGSLSASAAGGKKVGVVSAGNLVVAGGDTVLTIANPTAKNACGVSLSGNYEQVAGSLKVVAESGEVKQNGVFLSKKKTTANISGGVLAFEMAGEKSVGLALDKDSCAGTLSGGALLIAMSGDGAKGVKTDGSFTMTGGLLDATMSGGYVEELFEYEDDDGVAWNYYVTLTSSTKTSGGTATYNTSRLLNSGTYAVYDPSKAYAVKVGTLAIGGGTVRIRCTGTAGRGLGADDMTLSGGHFDIAVAGGPTDVYVESLVEADNLASNTYASVATCLDSGGAACLKTSGGDSSMRITGGTFLLSATGTAGKLINAAGSLSIGTAGAATLPTDASFSPDIQGSATGSKVYCCAIKQKYYGTLATATATTNLPDCAVAVDNVVTSSGGGWGGMNDDADYSNPKGVKAETGVEMHSGRLRVTTANDGGEGLESKAEMTIDGGLVELVCADDCVNTAGNLTINGGYIYAGSSGNDAFDSNANITINGGWIYAFTLSSPEEAFDVNSGYSITINGGCLFGIGNAQSGREGTIAGTQKYYQGSYTLPTSATWLKASGTDTVWGKIPAASSSGSAYLFCSVPGMTSGTAPTSAGTTAPTGANEVGFHGFYTTGDLPVAGDDDDELWAVTEHYSASYTTADSLWFNTEAAAAATSVVLWYSPDGGTTWGSSNMTVNSEWTSESGCWWHVEIPASELQAGTFLWAVSAYDASGNKYADNNGGANYSIAIAAPLWAFTEHYSASYTTADSIWFNTEASTAVTSVILWYSPDGGANWGSTNMTVNSEWTSDSGCWWHVEIPASELQSGTFLYAVSAYDASGNEYADNNGGANYSIDITAASGADTTSQQ